MILVPLAASHVPNPTEAAGLVSTRISGNQMTVLAESAGYGFIGGPEGLRIDMEGFGQLAAPGHPQLPVKRITVALPPDSRALSVAVLRTATTDLPGRYDIAPYPIILPAPGAPGLSAACTTMQDEWQAAFRLAYATDDPYPTRPAWLSGGGTYGRWAYAIITFCPFTYRAESGRLSLHRQAELLVTLEAQQGSDTIEGSSVLADAGHSGRARAQDVFENYSSVVELYRDAVPSIKKPREVYDYIILTTSSLAGAIEGTGFAIWKTALGHNVRTVLVTDPEVSGQPGIDLAERIRNFLRTHYGVWGIKYVLILGDYATVPMRICYPNPTYHVYNPSDPGLVAPGTPTDYYYADLSCSDEDSWDADGDGYHGEYGDDQPDFLAEVAIGRIPVNSVSRITYTLEKMMSFEQDMGAWKSNVLHGGAILFFENQNSSGYPFIDGASCLDSIETGLLNGFPITHFSEQTGIVTSLFPWPPISETAFTSSWGSNEFGIVNWSGHGWSDGVYRTVWVWDDGDGIPESTNGEMQSYRFIGTGASNLDDDYPSIVFAISCNVGYPDPNPYGNLGIDMLTLPGWGPSAGMLSSSRPASISSDWTVYGGGAEQICYDFNRFLIVESERVGDALYDGKFWANANYGWEHIYEYANLYNYNLYGDPALSRTGQPVALRVIPSVISGELVLRWNPVAGAGSYWIFGAPNAPGFEPENANRQAIVPAETLTWSSPNGVGDPTTNWTYVVGAVDLSENVMAASNRVGEMDFQADIR